jgi:radical SAM superfamily enzyme YgiQ (UPF0313 family)
MVFPITYIEPVFRPPSEANSLILPMTNGCSWNHCLFCEMYTAPQKAYRANPEDALLDAIRRIGESPEGRRIRRVFLADGDALSLPVRRLAAALSAIREHLPSVGRVSSYCLPRNLKKKSVADLKELAGLGLKLAYVGAESGDDEVLAKINKGESFASTLEALEKLEAAGIRQSVMVLNGLGGQALSRQHAENSARLANAAQPDFLATLVVSFPQGRERFTAAWPEWQELTIPGLLAEMETLLDKLDLKRTIFRSDHASNWLCLRGNFPEDKPRLLAEVRAALAHPENAPLRPAWARGL